MPTLEYKCLCYTQCGHLIVNTLSDRALHMKKVWLHETSDKPFNNKLINSSYNKGCIYSLQGILDWMFPFLHKFLCWFYQKLDTSCRIMHNSLSRSPALAEIVSKISNQLDFQVIYDFQLDFCDFKAPEIN